MMKIVKKTWYLCLDYHPSTSMHPWRLVQPVVLALSSAQVVGEAWVLKELVQVEKKPKDV